MRKPSLVAVLVLSFAGCKPPPPVPGTPCKTEQEWTCLSATSRAVCEAGEWRVDHCVSCSEEKSSGLFSSSGRKSASGCLRGGIGAEGAPCHGESFDCDGIEKVKCIDGVFRRFPCRGPKGCRHDEEGLLVCDYGNAREGDPCDSKVKTCAPDKKALIACVDGHFKRVQSCLGPKGCTHEGKEWTCDLTIGRVGEPCEGGGACSEERDALVACRDGKYEVARTCRGEPRCEVGEDSVACAHPELAEPGDACMAGNNACSMDHKSLLGCEDGKFVPKKACKKGCTFKGTTLSCK